jgi:hypothetical protein
MKFVSKCLVFLIVLSAAALYAGAAGLQATAQAQAPQEKVFEGALVKVDADAHSLTVMGADNKPLQFIYTDKTVVSGQEKSVQGLAGKAGAKLRITYRAAEKGANEATRIEIVPER